MNPQAWARWVAAVVTVLMIARGEDPALPDRMAQGRQMTQRAAGILSSNLLAALTQGGPTNAVGFCSTRALPLTVSAASDGASLHRISHRPRQPANRAQSNDLEVIRRFQAARRPGAGLNPVLTTNAAGQVSFYAPIILNTPLCLQCHGTPGVEVAEPTGTLLRQRYPMDEALGFKLGDLRGVWRVDFPPNRP